jgi:hypothetical protein
MKVPIISVLFISRNHRTRSDQPERNMVGLAVVSMRIANGKRNLKSRLHFYLHFSARTGVAKQDRRFMEIADFACNFARDALRILYAAIVEVLMLGTMD